MKQDRKSPDLRVVGKDPLLGEAEISTAFSTLGGDIGSQRLSLRADLETKSGPAGQMLVRKPDSPTWFPIYSFEWRIAQLFDGTRDLSDISTDIRHTGIGASPDLVRAFARELHGLGFLREATEEALRGETAEEETSPETRHLFAAAQTMQAKGDLEAATNYLTAILEIEPDNHMVRTLLRRLRGEIRHQPDEKPSEPPEVAENVVESATDEVANFGPEIHGLLAIAMKHHASGDFESAAQYLEAILEIEPSSTHVRDLLRHLQWKTLASTASSRRKTGPAAAVALSALHMQVEATNPGFITAIPSDARTPWSTYLLVAASLVGGLGGLAALVLSLWGGDAVGPSAAELKPAEQTATQTAGASEPESAESLTVVEPTHFKVVAALSAASKTTVTTPAAGVVADLLISDYQTVTKGDVLATVMPKRGFARHQRTLKQAKRLRARAETDTVARYKLPDIEKKLESLENHPSVTVITAPHSGRVARLMVSQGDIARATDPVLELDDAAVLQVKIARANVPDGVGPVHCEIIAGDRPPVPCQATAEGSEPDALLTFQVDNSSGTLKVGGEVSVQLSWSK